MATEIEIHPVQAKALRVLLFKKGARFSELNSDKIDNDHFTFHLTRLVEQGLVEKGEDGLYRLAVKGKEFANRFDTEEVVVEKQAKVGVLVVGVRNRGKKREYLIQQRLKEPYFGFHGFMTGKIKWGETVEEGAARELKEETGLEGKVRLMGVKHKMDYTLRDELLEDKYFFVFRASELKGELVEEFEGGKNMWLTWAEIRKFNKLFDGVEESIKLAEGKELVFHEDKYRVKEY